MNKTEQANQLRLAAELIETGHPLEWQQRDGKWYKCSSAGALNYLTQGFPIRPILATPPDNRPLHNPDNLTAEQVGLGKRLTLVAEPIHPEAEIWQRLTKDWSPRDQIFSGEAYSEGGTYRLPLSVPWPEVKADPYAELKAAHAAGEAIEAQMPNGEWFDYNPEKPQWNLQPECYRIKPEPATKEVELGPEDVPPATVLRGAGEVCSQGWCAITSCSETGIRIWRQSESSGHEITWQRLRESDSQINRSIPLTGKWDANAWEPCSKAVQIAH